MDVLFCLQIDFAIVLFFLSLSSSSSNNEIRCGAHMNVVLFFYVYTYESAALFFQYFLSLTEQPIYIYAKKKRGRGKRKKINRILAYKYKNERDIYIWHRCFTYAYVNQLMRHVYIIIQFIKKKEYSIKILKIIEEIFVLKINL